MDLNNIKSIASDHPEEPLLLLSLIETYWKSVQTISQAAEVVRAHPTISFINYPSSASLLQDQLLAVAHSQEWSFKVFSSCLQVLQNFVGTSNLIKSIFPVALKSIREKNPKHSAQALEIVLTQLKQQQENETNLLISVNNGYGRDVANDATSFQAASMVVERQFEGDNGELGLVTAQFNDLCEVIEKNNEEIQSLQNSLSKITKELTHQSRTCSLLRTILEHNPTEEEWKEVEDKIQKTLNLWRRVGEACSSFINGVVGE